MIIGIGIDVVRIWRIEKILERYGDRFLNRVFTWGEQEYCSQSTNPLERYAGSFAAKEASFKALGRGWDECDGFTSVEVCHSETKRPSISLHKMAKIFAETMNVRNIFVSITHDVGIASAVVLLDGEEIILTK